ncbi:MAG TPA: ketosynthase chain-length factor [Streptosporangiaceae bacterium]|nr:ketosynthase chain-length factor [Streptosporangiaceae bacterium]
MTISAVVTGMGVASPNGLGTQAYWRAVLRGESGIGRITRFDPSPYPATLAGEVPGFDATAHLPGRLIPQTDRSTQLALTAAQWALDDAGLGPDEPALAHASVVTSNAAGGFEFGQRELQNLWRKGSGYVSAYQSFAWFYAVNTGQISIRHGTRGPGSVLVAEQAGGLDAIGQARRHLRGGTALALTGAVEGALCPWGWAGLLASGRLSTSRDHARAFLPFDSCAAGHVPGEGGAILVMEERTSALRRGAPTVYGEVAGYAATFDPRPGTGREPGLRRAILLALADAGLGAADIGVVFADGAAVPSLDQAEADAITAVFGPRGVPVTVPKTMTGRLQSGGAALDVATALLALWHKTIPPTVNVGQLAPGARIDLVTAAPRRADIAAALVLARGHGGFNSALVVRATPRGGTGPDTTPDPHDRRS